MENTEIKRLEKSSRKSGLLSLSGILIFISSLIYASISLNNTTTKLEESERKISDMAFQIDSLNVYFKKLNESIEDMKGDEKKLTNFLIQLIKSSSTNSVTNYEDVDWEKLTIFLTHLPSGKRKTAIFISLLMTWKEIPFELGQMNPSLGFDSPSFLSYVIEQVGISVESGNNQFLSSAMMRRFQRVDKPLPGDLIFYRGQTGNFGLMYVCDCTTDGKGLAIGTLQKISSLSIYQMKNINTQSFPLVGFFRVNYEDYE